MARRRSSQCDQALGRNTPILTVALTDGWATGSILMSVSSTRADVGAKTVIAGHAFIDNIRRGHYELAADSAPKLGVAAVFDELA
jgi:hypothetical protein